MLDNRMDEKSPENSQPQTESPIEMLRRLGDDAAKWAQEFHDTAMRLGYSDMDVGWLIGWFANAIEYSHDLRQHRRELGSAEADIIRAIYTKHLKLYGVASTPRKKMLWTVEGLNAYFVHEMGLSDMTPEEMDKLETACDRKPWRPIPPESWTSVWTNPSIKELCCEQERVLAAYAFRNGLL